VGFRVLGALTCVALGDAEEIHVAFFAAFENSPRGRKRLEKPGHLCQLRVAPARHASVPRLATVLPLVLQMVDPRLLHALPHSKLKKLQDLGHAAPRALRRERCAHLHTASRPASTAWYRSLPVQ